MIIQKVILSPFGAAANRSYSFSKGLNVLLGPNEAGKSTLVNAIFAALFIPADVRKNAEEWTKILQRYLPYPDGDTARVALELIPSDGQVMLYSCAWGGSREQRLVLDGGNEVNDPAAIRAHLEQALRFGRGTYESVLFARQEEMNQTLARLKNNENAKATISGLLRAALFESGGVSLEKFEILIISEYKRLLNNWDLSSDEPRGGRGISNPHQTKRGAVLLAYYEAEELRRLLRNTRADEEKVTALGEEIGRFEAEQTQLRGCLVDYEKLEKDARKRSSLKPGLDALSTKENQLMAVISEWPKVEERANTLSAAIETKKKSLEKLEQEHQEAVAVLVARDKRNLFLRVQQLKAELDSKQAELIGLPTILTADLHSLEEQNRRLTELKAVAGAMKLKAAVKAKTKLKLTVTAGMEEPRDMVIEAEETLAGDGRLLLESEAWTINIQSGNEDFEQLIAEANRCRNDYEARLVVVGLDDLKAVRAVVGKRNEIEASLKTVEARLKDQLGAWNYNELEAAVAGLGKEIVVRDAEVIRGELDSLKLELGTEKTRLELEKEKLTVWENEYESLSQIFSRMADLRLEANEIKKALETLASLPEQYVSDDHFIDDLKRMRSRSDELKDLLAGLQQELLEVQRRMPEESTKELGTQLILAEEKLDRLKRSGKAALLVKHEFNQLKKELDAHTYAPLVEKFGRYLALATDSRYGLAALEGAVPGKITSAEGRTLPVELLSAGTSSGVALALRLALAAYLLQGAEGFLVMDDPLVHLDPERRKSAAALIREFAADKQTIITTCDPQTATLLGGRLVTLG